MSKCKFCGKPDEGIICRACLTRGTSKMGNGIKKAIIPIISTAATGIAFKFSKSKSKD